MILIEILLGLIDIRSFASVWFWIVLALFWSGVSQTALGVSFDLLARAQRDGGQDAQDLHALIEIAVRRKLALFRRVGHWFFGFGLAIFSAILILGFFYRLEFAQAVCAIVIPLMIVRLMSLQLAFQIERQNLQGDKLYRALRRHRLYVRFLGIVAISITAIWGMWSVMSRTVLGG